MASAGSGKSKGEARPDRLVVASLRAAILAPGGFVAGYLCGSALGRVLGGCPLSGECDVALPVFLALPVAIVGMGAANTLAAARVRYWWEGVAVWGVGIAAMTLLVIAVGWLGSETIVGRLVALLWLIAAVGLAVVTWRSTVLMRTTSY